MATGQESGVSSRGLSGVDDDRRRSEPTRHPSPSAQVPRRSLPSYLRDWTGSATNNGAMASTGPAIGLFSVGAAPSLATSARPGKLTHARESLAQAQPAINSAILSSISSGSLAEATRCSGDLSQLRSSDKGYGEHTKDSGAARRSDRFSNQTQEVMPISTLGSAPSQPVPLREIGRLDGDTIYIPPKLLQQFYDIAQENRNSLLPFAKAIWGNGQEMRSAETFADGSPRKWLTDVGRVEIKVARFRYGPRHQILLAQGLPGSQWENGEVVVIGSGSSVQGGSRMWKVWRGRQFDEQYTVCCVRSFGTVVGDYEYSISEKRGATDRVASSAITVPVLHAHTNRRARTTNVPARPIVLKYTPRVKKRGLTSFSYPSLDNPIATQKRPRFATAESGSTSTGGSTQVSPELGSSTVPPSDTASPRAALATTPLSSPPIDASAGSISGLPAIEDAAWSLPSFGQQIAQIENQDAIPALSQPTFTPPSVGNNALILPYFKKEEREVIEIEDDDGPPKEDPNSEIENLKYVFVNSKGGVTDKNYLYKSCDSIGLLFRAADVADIINSDIHKLTITVVDNRGRKELNVGRDFEEDFERMKLLVNSLEATEIRVARGTKVTFD